MNILNSSINELMLKTKLTESEISKRRELVGQTKNFGAKYKKGAVIQKFCLIHKKHQELLIQAAGLVEQLEVFIIRNKKDKYYLTTFEQKRIIATILADSGFENFKITVLEKNESFGIDFELELLNYDSQIQAIFSYVPINYVLFANEELLKNSYKKNQDISTKIITSDLYQFDKYNMLPKQTKVYLNKKVTIIGSESCGKTTMVKKLASIFDTAWSEEYGRYYSANYFGKEDSAFTPSDFVHIINAQIMQDKNQNILANRVLFVDTDPLTTLFYFYYVFENFSTEWLGTSEFKKAEKTLINAIRNYSCDLHILLTANVPHIEDGTRWADESIKEKVAKQYKDLAIKHNINFIEITESLFNDRLLTAIKLIEEKLGILP